MQRCHVRHIPTHQTYDVREIPTLGSFPMPPFPPTYCTSLKRDKVHMILRCDYGGICKEKNLPQNSPYITMACNSATSANLGGNMPKFDKFCIWWGTCDTALLEQGLLLAQGVTLTNPKDMAPKKGPLVRSLRHADGVHVSLVTKPCQFWHLMLCCANKHP